MVVSFEGEWEGVFSLQSSVLSLQSSVFSLQPDDARRDLAEH